MWIYYAGYIDHNCANAVSLHNTFRTHIFTCSEQFNSIYYGTDFERYNERNLSDLLIETDDEYIELYFEWKKEHPMQMATQMPKWI